MSPERKYINSKLKDFLYIEPPPDGFRLLRATPDELHMYGLPHRPDPNLSPDAARAWMHVMRRVKRFVMPELRTRRDIVHQPFRRLRRIQKQGSRAVIHGGSGWSGTVITDAPPYTAVWGIWTIPQVQVPPNPPNGVDNFFCATWVGLGGFGINNLLQAGTEQDVSIGAEPQYSAWTEWVPGISTTLDWPVEAGQSIAAFVGDLGDGSGRGLVIMANLETGDMTTPIIVPIPTIDFFGNPIPAGSITLPSGSAEWIVERPAFAINEQVVLTELADYGEVNFTMAGASSAVPGSKDEVNVPAATDPNAIAIAMLADDGVTVLSEETTTPSLQVTFLQTGAFNPSDF
jgi:hypothetical protein